MDHPVNYDASDHYLEPEMESPVDEAAVHDSFSHLIQEQATLDDLEMDLLELDEEARDDVGHLLPPMSCSNGRYQQECPPSDQWSSATLRILSSMPSRTIGRSRGAIISQYYNRTMQLRRHRQSRPSIRDFSRSSRPSIRGYGGVESDGGDLNEEDAKRERLVNNLRNLSMSDRVRMLKTMPLSVMEKTDLRRQAFRHREHPSSSSNIPCCSQLKYYLMIVARQTWYSWLSLLASLQLWQTALKTVSGRFGTGVLSYFVFLKTLLFFNLFLTSMIGLFLVLPQAISPPLRSNSTGLSGLELLTGGGYFTESVLFYGYYTNATLEKHCPKDNEAGCGNISYSMSLAYFFVIGAAFFVTGIILVYTMSKLFGQSFRIDKSRNILAMKVFSSWDFKVIKKTSVKLQSENISTQLKELLADVGRKRRDIPIPQRLARIALHSFAWTLCVGSTVACGVGVYYFSEFMHTDLETRAQNRNSASESPLVKEASLLALPAVVSSINLFLPGFFNIVASLEKYDSPSVRNYVAISRNLMLKVTVLGVLCYHWLGRIAAQPQRLHLECWETFVGQDLYRFLVMDFIFTLLDTFFGEFLWRLFSQKLLKRKRKPVFDIARNVLELIYGQTLTWMGVLFTPLLPAVQILKLVFLFYLKKTSLMMNCQVPRRPWRATQMTTIFITLLCFPSFLGAAVCVTCTFWSIKPSGNCGPFRGLDTMIQSGKTWVKDLEESNSKLAWLTWVHTYLVENPVIFLFITAMTFIIVIYFHTQVVDGQRKVITLLQEQIANEGDDKKFLITRLQAIHEQNRPLSPNRIRLDNEASSYY
ncbi:transmembrane channel-like protein 6b [Engraulis encrasicolus]|uniref:transmembrane channel-like protein 6b n=1 Tax=Engraulis encrasicolus TaxID=184585 RepID=UPI002FD513AE